MRGLLLVVGAVVLLSGGPAAAGDCQSMYKSECDRLRDWEKAQRESEARQRREDADRRREQQDYERRQRAMDPYNPNNRILHPYGRY